MKQVALLPSGCQTWHKNILGSGSSGHFVYASTLSTYVHSSGDYSLTSLQTAHTRTITGVAWQPSASNSNEQDKSPSDKYVTISADMHCIRWSATSAQELNSLTLENIPIMVEWGGHSSLGDDQIAIVLKTGQIVMWDGVKTKSTLVEGMKDSVVACIRWNYSSARTPILAAGRIDGTLLLYDAIKKKITSKIAPPEPKDGEDKSGEIVDIAWDPLSNQYLLVTYQSGMMLLIDTESEQVLQQFNRVQHDVTMLAFLPSSPGDFITINDVTNNITVWNVSQKKEKEIVKVKPDGGNGSAASGVRGKSGIFSIKLLANSNNNNTQSQTKFLLAFQDGSVGLYDYSTRHLDYLSQPAHSETIFDIRYKPGSSANGDILATASYDSTIKIWNTQKYELLQTLKGHDGVLYTISWAPPASNGGDSDSENRLVSGGSEGTILIWNTQTGQILTTCKHHTKPVYTVKYHPSSEMNLIASASSDNYVCLFTSDQGKVIKKYKHPAACYGIDWNTFNRNLLVTGCHDGIVRIYDITSTTGDSPVKELIGHTARVFHTVWSPLLPDRFASGSDDKTIRVWDVSSNASSGSSSSQASKCVVLKGHTSNIRALTWSYEIPYLLLSGSWDSTIRLWDIRTGKCLSVIQDHHADIYGLTSHPSRPFAFVSCSRDTSLRFWTMEETLVKKIKIQAILSDGLIQPSHLEDPFVLMKSGSNSDDGSVKLCGTKSLDMIGKHVRDMKDLERYATLFQYFTNTQGVKELWALLEALVNNKSTLNGNENANGDSSSLLHVNDVRQASLLHTYALHASKNSSIVGIGKRSDRILSAANSYLSLGLIKEYCELQIELGDWVKALSVAPAAGVSYWKLLTVRHALHLAEKGDHTGSAQSYLVSGEIKLLLKQQIYQRDIVGAFLSAVCEANGSLPMLPPLEEEDEKKFQILTLGLNGGGGSGGSGSSSGNNSAAAAMSGGGPPSAAVSSVVHAALPLPSSSSKQVADHRDSIPITDHIRQIAEIQADTLFKAGQPVLSACAYLRIGDAYSCINTLLLGNETLLALAICRVLKLQFSDHVYLATSKICEELGMYDDALKCLHEMRNPRDEIILLASRFVGPSNKKAEFYLKAGIRSQDSWLSSAELSQKDSSKAYDTLLALLAGGAYERCLSYGIDVLHEILSPNNNSAWSLEDVKRLTDVMNCAPLVPYNVSANTQKLSDLRQQYLLYSYYIGAQHAQVKGYSTIVAFLFESISSLNAKMASSNIQVSFPVPTALLRLQEANYFQQLDSQRSLNLLKDLLAESNVNVKYKTAANALKKTIETVHVAAAAAGGNGKKLSSSSAAMKATIAAAKNVIIPSCSHLPHGAGVNSVTGAHVQLVSVITHQPIVGPRLNVDQPPSAAAASPSVAEGAQDPSANYVSLGDALMLSKCTPFSPNHTGQRLKIFVQ